MNYMKGQHEMSKQNDQVRIELEKATLLREQLLEELVNLCESFPQHFQSLYMESLLGQIRRAELGKQVLLKELAP